MNRERLIVSIEACTDPGLLRRWMRNLQEREPDLFGVALRRLLAILPQEAPGTVEHDFWQTIHAFEHVLTEERGRTTRLSRTRQKVGRVGEMQTLKDWALARSSSDGFDKLVERRMAEFTGEAIVLRHADKFEAKVVAAARRRLEAAGLDVESLVRR